MNITDDQFKCRRKHLKDKLILEFSMELLNQDFYSRKKQTTEKNHKNAQKQTTTKIQKQNKQTKDIYVTLTCLHRFPLPCLQQFCIFLSRWYFVLFKEHTYSLNIMVLPICLTF